MANSFKYYGFIILKLLIFRVDNNVFWNIQNAQDRNIFI